jgi:hypothetical protein
MLHLAARAPRRCPPLSSNVRHRTKTRLEAHASSPPSSSCVFARPVARPPSAIKAPQPQAPRREVRAASNQYPRNVAAAGVCQEVQFTHVARLVTQVVRHHVARAPVPASVAFGVPLSVVAPHVARPVRAFLEGCCRWRSNQEPHALVTPKQCRPNHLTSRSGTRSAA